MRHASITYILPIRGAAPFEAELSDYLRCMAECMPVIVVDGSDPSIFARNAAQLDPRVVHVPVDPARRDANGKVAGVHTGMRLARTPFVVIADDDVRYEQDQIATLCELLEHAEIVRPQNYFTPLPWHAALDSGRILIARATGGDWPGTLALRRRAFARAGGYDGDVLFENLELVRSLRAKGARETIAWDLFVARRPPATKHFLQQRVRQAYDEFARPRRLAVQLALLPAFIAGARAFGARAVLVALLVPMALAEAGRRRAGAAAVFPPVATLFAPLWIAERAFTAWAAVFVRLFWGGVAYRGRRLRIAAHSERALREGVA